MGFVAVFAGAANTPIASTLMAIELFGASAGSYAAIACIVSCQCSGRVGIYSAQRIDTHKFDLFLPPLAKIEPSQEDRDRSDL
jgi:H+/Cl- antiporter ClcA